MKDRTKEKKKEFSVPKRDGGKRNFTFVKQEGVWFWDLPGDVKPAPGGMVVSLPLPDVNLDGAKTVKECLNLIAQQRGENWVGQVVGDLLKCKGDEPTT